MRIAFLTWEFPPEIVGGLGVYSDNAVRQLRAYGHEVVVFAPKSDELPEIGEYEGTSVVRPQTFNASAAFPHVINWELQEWGEFFGDLLLTNLLWVDRLRLLHAERPFDLIAVQDWLSAPAGLILAEQSLAPIVFHVHSTEWGRRGEGVSATVTYWEQELGQKAHAVITVSQAMRLDLIDHGFPQGKVHAIWNGIDPDQYSPEVTDRDRIRAIYEISDDDVLGLFVGRLTDVKGVLPVVEAWTKVAAVFPEARLVILGVGELQNEIEQRIVRLRLDDLVSLRCEFVSEEERIGHYAAADICIFPSKYEPFGIVCLEAMATAKPVVVGARGLVGFREQVVNEEPMKCGVHVNGASADDIAWGVGQCLKDPERAALWGQNGRKRAISHFTWAETTRKTLEVYEAAISEH